MKLLFVAIGGALGSILRYGLSGSSHRHLDGVFPWGTLTVNLIGSFLIGLLWGAFEETTVSPNIRTFLFIGVLGGFTTFSSYSLETFSLLREGETRLALTNILVSNVAGLGLCLLGFATSKLMVNIAR